MPEGWIRFGDLGADSDCFGIPETAKPKPLRRDPSSLFYGMMKGCIPHYLFFLSFSDKRERCTLHTNTNTVTLQHLLTNSS